MLSDGRPCGNQESHSPITIHFFRSAAPLGAVNSGSDPLQWETVGLRVRRDQPDFGYWSRVRRGRLVNTGALAVGGTVWHSQAMERHGSAGGDLDHFGPFGSVSGR